MPKAMLRLEQITALVLAAALAIPSYWFFWSLAGGGGYDRRKVPEVINTEKKSSAKFDQKTKDRL